ncbi:MAG: hypothetical protein WC764_02010 [Candidatus Paceibacterota bacterium]|jgi:hypothetical protein
MFRTVFISLLVGITGVAAAFTIQPASSAPQQLEAQKSESVTASPHTTQNALSQFQSVAWNTPNRQNQNEQNVFDAFSPFIQTFSKSISLSDKSTSTLQPTSLPKNVLAIEPLGSLARYMNSLAPAGNAPFASALSETQVRNTLNSGGISINAQPPQTIVAGLGQQAVDGLLYFHNQAGSFTVTGGTEGGHQTHGTQNTYTENNVDIGKGTGLDTFIENNKISTRPGTNGTIYKLKDANGQNIECMDEGNHWHCMFNPDARGINQSTDQPDGDSGDGDGSGESGSGGGTSSAYCGDDYWSDEDICCYKHTGPAGPPGQYDGVTTCNAGFKMAGDPPIPTPVPNCGRDGKLCDLELTLAQPGGKLLSCLFAACPPKRNAIWDPQTKRCGCDDGGSGIGVASGGGSGDNGTEAPSTSATGDQQGNTDKLAARGVTLQNGVQVGGLTDNTMNGIDKFAADYKANTGNTLEMSAGTNGTHDANTPSGFTHANGGKTDFSTGGDNTNSDLARYIKNPDNGFTFDHNASDGPVYHDGNGNIFYLENSGTAPHLDVAWAGNNTR